MSFWRGKNYRTNEVILQRDMIIGLHLHRRQRLPELVHLPFEE